MEQECYIPRRWIIAIMGFFAFFNTYTLRVCLSMAILKMVAPLNKTRAVSDDTCAEYGSNGINNDSLISFVDSTFEWDEYTQGIILSCFYWGYVVTHFPAGVLIKKFGPKLIMGLSIFLNALLTLATPSLTLWGDYKALVIIRVIMGAFQGLIQPSVSSLLSQWIPPEERSVMGSIVYPGVGFGVLVSTSLSGLILSDPDVGWPTVFYIFGGTAMIWVVFWVLLSYDSPRQHPFISEAEEMFLNKKLEKITHVRVPSIPWKRIFLSRPFLALVIAQSGSDWCSYTVMADLPKYMNNVLKLPVKLTGYASSLNNLTAWLYTLLLSAVSDWSINKGFITRTNVRKINATIATVVMSIFLVSGVYAGCDQILAVFLITVGLTIKGSSVPSLKVNVLDLSPNYAGTLMGLDNGIGAITGIFAPYIVGILAPNQTLAEWKIIFWIMLIIVVITNTIYLIFGSGEVQKWNDPEHLFVTKNNENKTIK